MDTIKSPLQVWVHLSADLTRNLLQLPATPEQFLSLQQKLRRARLAGVDGIIVPVSWRHIAPFTPEQVDEVTAWHPYHQLFTMIRGEGLQIVRDLALVARVLSDVRYMSLLPDWLWGRLQQELPADMPLVSLKFLDQHGRDSIMATSLWASAVTMPYFRQFMRGFAHHLSAFAPAIRHIQLGVGPEGEWRYPFLGHYAEEGLSAYFPCYSQRALGVLADGMLHKYQSLSAWQQAWQAPGLDLCQPAVL